MTEQDRKKLKLHKKNPVKTASSDTKPWRILVVDDDAQVHSMTDLLFKDFVFEGNGFEAVHAYSAAEAAERLANDPEIPVALVDVVMEQPDAGLNLVKIIRGKLENPSIRIILRTGQPGEAPEREVIQEYDINDYKAKTELTSQKLFTALVGALRSWRDIMYAAKMAELLAEANDTLERKVEERTQDLSKALEKVNEAKCDLRQFLSMMSHEFRTPLAVIDSAAQMLMLR
jgi:CheY-like chemotaxis protein